jgi:phosphatidylserine/phosphatidylglycerophosphate/cardiolipin synthase-like enzyme
MTAARTAPDYQEHKEEVMSYPRTLARAAIGLAGAIIIICLGAPAPLFAQDNAPAAPGRAYLPLALSQTDRHGDRGECAGLADCVTLTHAGEYTYTDQDATLDQAEAVEFTCPADYPYVWDWGYAADADLDVWLAATTMPPADGLGEHARFDILRTAADATALQYKLYVACTATPQTPDAVADEAAELPALLPEAALLVEVEPVRTFTQDGTATDDDLANLSYVGLAVWRYLTLSDPGSKYLGVTYDYSNTNAFAADAILQTPRHAWGATGAEYQFSVPNACLGSEGCDPDFQLQQCTVQADCAFTNGVCTAVEATVTAPGQAPRQLCLRSQDVLWNEVYKVVVSAQQQADITTLSQGSGAPDGRFLRALRNAVTYLAHTGRTVNVRLLVGHYISMWTDARGLVEAIAADAKNVAGNKVSVFVAGMLSSYYPMSMNHSKIVAADGVEALVGGQNQYNDDYLSINPAFDLTLRVRGPAAYSAHAFAQRLWTYVCSWNPSYSVYSASYIPGSGFGKRCSTAFPVTRTGGPGATAVFPVGRLGTGIAPSGDNPNQSEAAILGMLQAAQHTIRIAQQDIAYGTGGYWDKEVYNDRDYTNYNHAYMNALADRLIAGLDVYVVFSNFGAKTGVTQAGHYYNGYRPATIAQGFKWFVSRRPGAPTGAALNALLCEHLHLSTFRFGPNDTWFDGVTPPGTHAKTISVDEQAFYVGSHNFYPMDLQEYGLIVDDPVLTQRYLTEYWDNLWNYSKRVAVSGSDASQCIFQSTVAQE